MNIYALLEENAIAHGHDTKNGCNSVEPFQRITDVDQQHQRAQAKDTGRGHQTGLTSFDRRRGWRRHGRHMHRELSGEKFLSRYEDYLLIKSLSEPRCRDLNLDVFTEFGGCSVI
jgi:hypothetical protein